MIIVLNNVSMHDSFIIFKFIKTKSQILVSSLNTQNVCDKSRCM